VRIYLAGAASKKYEDRCRIWRRTATKKLEEVGFEVINPIKDYPINKDYQIDEMMEIVDQDLIYVASSDLILAEVGTMPHPYIGTSMEIRYAYENFVPVIVWSPLKQNFFLEYHSTKIYSKLKDAVSCCIAFKMMMEGENDEI